jgi:hypothetical protein
MQTVHIGMWESAVLMDAQLSTVIAEALHGVCKGYKLTLTGHSLGAGVATLLALRWKPLYPDLVSFMCRLLLLACVGVCLSLYNSYRKYSSCVLGCFYVYSNLDTSCVLCIHLAYLHTYVHTHIHTHTVLECLRSLM